MVKQMTEMLKGTLEGIVFAILSGRPAYGYEITARLREEGFSDIAEGTVYALLVRIEQSGLVDVEKVPSEKGPPRKVYSLNAQGQEYLEEFWRTWSFLTERLEQLRTEGSRDGQGLDRAGHRIARAEEAVPPAQGEDQEASRELRAAFDAVERYLMYAGGIAKGDVVVRMYGDLADLFEQSAANGTPIREIVGEDPVEFVETFVANYSEGSWINKERARLVESIERAEREDAAGER